MRNGDITNKAAPYVAFDLDSLLWINIPDERTKFKKIADFFTGTKRVERKYNTAFTNCIRQLWNKHNISVVFIIENYDDEALEELGKKLDIDLIPYTHLYAYQEWDYLRQVVHGTFQYFFSGNEELLSFISANHALNFDKVKEIFG